MFNSWETLTKSRGHSCTTTLWNLWASHANCLGDLGKFLWEFFWEFAKSLEDLDQVLRESLAGSLGSSCGDLRNPWGIWPKSCGPSWPTTLGNPNGNPQGEACKSPEGSWHSSRGVLREIYKNWGAFGSSPGGILGRMPWGGLGKVMQIALRVVERFAKLLEILAKSWGGIMPMAWRILASSLGDRCVI